LLHLNAIVKVYFRSNSR